MEKKLEDSVVARTFDLLKVNPYMSLTEIQNATQLPGEKRWTRSRATNAISRLKGHYDTEIDKIIKNGIRYYAVKNPFAQHECKRKMAIIPEEVPETNTIFVTDEDINNANNTSNTSCFEPQEESPLTPVIEEFKPEEVTEDLPESITEPEEEEPAISYSPSEAIRNYVDKCMHYILGMPEPTTVENLIDVYDITEEEANVLLSTVSRKYPKLIKLKIEAKAI